MGLLNTLPPPPLDKYGWPWTEETDPELYSDVPFWPKISVVSVNFNQAQYLEESIRSVLLQNYPNLEYRIIDSGSDVHSKEIIGKYEKFLTSCESKPNAVTGDLITHGITLSSGKIFNWLHSDDYYNPRTFFIVAENFVENQNIHVVSGRYQFYTGDNSLDEIIPKFNLETPAGKILAGNFNQPPTFFSTEAIRKIAPFNNSLHFTGYTELWQKYLLTFGKANIISIEDILVNSKNHDKLKSEIKIHDFFNKQHSSPAVELNSIMHDIAVKNRFTKEAEAIKKLSPSVQKGYTFNYEFGSHHKPCAKSIIDYYLFRHGFIFYQEGNLKKAHDLFKCINPDSLEKYDRRFFRKLFLKSFFSAAVKLKRKILL